MPDLADQLVAALAQARRPLPVGGLLHCVDDCVRPVLIRKGASAAAACLRPHLETEAAVKAFTSGGFGLGGRNYHWERSAQPQLLQLWRASGGQAVSDRFLRRVLRLPRVFVYNQLELPMPMPPARRPDRRPGGPAG
jgi:hypothetical protein